MQPNGAPLTSILFCADADHSQYFCQLDASRLAAGRAVPHVYGLGARVPHLVAGPHPRGSLGQFAAPPLHSEELVRRDRLSQY